MRFYNAKCNLDGSVVTLPIAESDLLEAYREYVTDIIADKVGEYMDETYPYAKELLGKNYRNILCSIAHYLLDTVGIGSKHIEEISAVHIEDAVRKNLFRYYSFSTLMLHNDEVHLYAKCVKNGKIDFVATITKNAVVFCDDRDEQYLDVLREISYAKALLG